MALRAPLALRARFVPRLLAWASSHGLDAVALAKRCGLPEPTGENEPLVPLSALRALARAVASELDDPLLGLHVAQALQPADYGALGFLARSAGSLGEALEFFVANAAALSPAWTVSLERRGACARVHQRIPGEPRGFGPEGNDYFTCGLVVMARRLARGEVIPTRAWVAHRAKPHPGLESFLGCPLETGREENGLEVAASILCLPVETGDPTLADWLRRAVLPEANRGGDALAELRRLIRESLPEAVPLRAAARSLAQSPRSLQRRLADERSSYTQEVNRVRGELAQDLLVEGLELGEIAYRTGFSDTRTFARAFKRWTGLTPGEARKRAASRPGR